MVAEFEDFLSQYEETVIPLSRELNESYFNASISGKPEAYQKASELQLKLNKVFANKEDFKKLQRIKDFGDLGNPVYNRQLILIYNNYAGNQFDEKLLEEIVNLSTTVEEKFATYRANIDGVEYSDNQIDEKLKESKDTPELEKYWKASKQIGKEVAENVKQLVLMRNKAAKSLGFNNYHTMSLTLSEQDPEELDTLFDELDDLTRDAFLKLKSEIDNYLSEKYGIEKDKLMPWHYEDKFFQQGPRIYSVDLDHYFTEKDIVKITKDYFASMGLNIDDLIEKSDLFEKPGKYQHAYCIDIDRAGDTRVVCNIKPNYKWMGTMLHEYGHAAYEKYLSQKLPWVLKEPAHTFTTEAIAMMFGRFASSPVWLRDVLGITEADKMKIEKDCSNTLRLEQLVLTRWVQVMYRFEREMYANPEQDLNFLWWKLVEKYQKIKMPNDRDEPDWASKIHVALYPAYYHNYMLGELLASQLYSYITKKVLNSEKEESFFGNKEVGNYLINLFFSYGSVYNWRELIINSTGEALNPKYYADQFI